MKFFVFLMTIILISGCASAPVYDPVLSATSQVLLLNESAFKAVKEGMSQKQVHEVMGETIVIGYSAQKDSSAYKPLTIPNPYNTQIVKTTKGDVTVEFYVTSVKQPDGIVSNDELLPFIFQNGILVSRGWDAFNSLGRALPNA